MLDLFFFLLAHVIILECRSEFWSRYLFFKFLLEESVQTSSHQNGYRDRCHHILPEDRSTRSIPISITPRPKQAKDVRCLQTRVSAGVAHGESPRIPLDVTDPSLLTDTRTRGYWWAHPPVTTVLYCTEISMIHYPSFFWYQSTSSPMILIKATPKAFHREDEEENSP